MQNKILKTNTFLSFTRNHLQILRRYCHIAFAFLVVQSCSAPVPDINIEYFPKNYLVKDNVLKSHQLVDRAWLIPVNQNQSNLQAVNRLWRNHRFYPLFKQRHPLQDYTERDIQVLDMFLRDKLNVYYVIPQDDTKLVRQEFKNALSEKINCEPLSNIELSYIMSSDSKFAFSSKSLTMLVISSHELLLKTGATPEYPLVVSPYLRKKLNLAPIAEPTNINLFATKKTTEIYLPSNGGFIYCRKPDSKDMIFKEGHD